MNDYATRRERLAAELRSTPATPVRLAKSSSNLFRDRPDHPRRSLDVRAFDHVLGVDAAAGRIEAEGMVPYDVLAAAALKKGCMPMVVPQLKSITLGGATAGVGIEASSFRHGLVHETILDMDVLTGDGRIVLCTPDNEHADLFYGFPNSYGTLGYALRLRARTMPVKRFVKIERARHHDPATYFRDLDAACRSDADFVDGVVFARDEMFINTGHFVDSAPYTNDYTGKAIYYRSIRTHPVDYLETEAFLWRWDTDWFWCSKNFGAQHPLVRPLFGRSHLNSRTYARLMRLNARLGVTRRIDRIRGRYAESVIQDVDIPLARAPDFLELLHAKIGILPIWICPIRPSRSAGRFKLYRLDPDTLYVNFGFWDVVRRAKAHDAGHFNRIVERAVMAAGGIKSLYSDSFFTREEFWSIYERAEYVRLKSRYDPQGALGDLYDKCVLGQ